MATRRPRRGGGCLRSPLVRVVSLRTLLLRSGSLLPGDEAESFGLMRAMFRCRLSSRLPERSQHILYIPCYLLSLLFIGHPCGLFDVLMVL